MTNDRQRAHSRKWGWFTLYPSQFSHPLIIVQARVDGNGATGNGLPRNLPPLTSKKLIVDCFSDWLLVPDNPLPVTPNVTSFHNLGLTNMTA